MPAETFYKKYVLDCMCSLFAKIKYILSFPSTSLEVSQSYLRCSLPGCSPHITPNNLTHNSHVVHFLFSFFLVGIFITENEKILRVFLWLNKEAE